MGKIEDKLEKILELLEKRKQKVSETTEIDLKITEVTAKEQNIINTQIEKHCDTKIALVCNTTRITQIIIPSKILIHGIELLVPIFVDTGATSSTIDSGILPEAIK